MADPDPGHDRRRAKRGSRRARIHRTPEAARAHILDAASRVLAELGPDRAGLKEVAAAAGVSHSLITHYFGTFSALVEEVLQAQMSSLRDKVVQMVGEADADLGIPERIHLLFVAFEEPVCGRLAAWALLSGRIDEAAFYPVRHKGLQMITDAIIARTAGGADVDRAAIERLVILIWCIVASYPVAAPALWRALGREPTAERDEQFEALVVEIATQRFGAL